MGNCIDTRRGATWVDDDDWEFSDEDEHEETTTNERRSLFRKRGSDSAGTTASAPKEVKIRIKKKQLRELLRKAEGKGLPADEVAAELVGFVESHEFHHESHWKPALQSIPENEE